MSLYARGSFPVISDTLTGGNFPPDKSRAPSAMRIDQVEIHCTASVPFGGEVEVGTQTSGGPFTLEREVCGGSRNTAQKCIVGKPRGAP